MRIGTPAIAKRTNSFPVGIKAATFSGFRKINNSARFPSIAGFTAEEQAITEAFQSVGLSYGVCSQKGMRPYQEDAYSIRPFINSNGIGPNLETEDTHFFGLFDGHAGARCSKHLSASLADVLSEDPSFLSSLPSALKSSYHTANGQFLQIAEKMRLNDGSTGLSVVIRGRKLVVANVGDCRALLLSGGKSIQLSTDQKPTNPDEQRRIYALGGTIVNCFGIARVNGVLAVARAFGNRTLSSVIRPDAEISIHDLNRDDNFVVVGSDGLWDVMTNKDVGLQCYALSGQPCQLIASELVQTALSRGSMDNVTCIVVKLTEYTAKLLQCGEVRGESNLPVVNDFSRPQTAGRKVLKSFKREIPYGRIGMQSISPNFPTLPL